MAVSERSIEIDVPPKKFYEIVVDFAKYAEFVDGAIGAETLKASEKNPRVRMDIKIIKKISYVLDFDLVPGKSVKWTLAEKGFFKKNDGSWTLEALDKGKRTRATYRVDLEIASLLVPDAILKQLNEISFPKMLGEFKKRAERT
jgi:ribosome-associated toxin RatA of RatAB toxin-antitoxin module